MIHRIAHHGVAPLCTPLTACCRQCAEADRDYRPQDTIRLNRDEEALGYRVEGPRALRRQAVEELVLPARRRWTDAAQADRPIPGHHGGCGPGSREVPRLLGRCRRGTGSWPGPDRNLAKLGSAHLEQSNPQQERRQGRWKTSSDSWVRPSVERPDPKPTRDCARVRHMWKSAELRPA